LPDGGEGTDDDFGLGMSVIRPDGTPVDVSRVPVGLSETPVSHHTAWRPESAIRCYAASEKIASMEMLPPKKSGISCPVL
jgi:hypothetical protein